MFRPRQYVEGDARTMTEPTELDREMYKSAIDRARKMRIMADYPPDFMEYEEREIIEAIAAAREEGRREAISEAAFIAECQGPTKISELIRNLIPKEPK